MQYSSQIYPTTNWTVDL